jgi:hypothetical protein
MCRSALEGRGRSARARRRMSGAFSSVWKAVRELGKPSGSLSFTSRKTSSSSNHDFHLHHVGLEVTLWKQSSCCLVADAPVLVGSGYIVL